jgi:hypothetical protein
VRRKTTISGLLALCGLALLVQRVAELGSNFHGDHLFAGLLLLTLAGIVWCQQSERDMRNANNERVPRMNGLAF